MRKQYVTEVSYLSIDNGTSVWIHILYGTIMLFKKILINIADSSTEPPEIVNIIIFIRNKV